MTISGVFKVLAAQQRGIAWVAALEIRCPAPSPVCNTIQCVLCSVLCILRSAVCSEEFEVLRVQWLYNAKNNKGG